MFEREIKFINDFTINQVRQLGTNFTFSNLSNINIHPAILNYISSEIDYLIFEDRQKLLQSSNFDYSGEKINKYFQLINDEVKKEKLLSFEYVGQLILHASSFIANYLAQPKWALCRLIFTKSEVMSVKEIKLIINYSYYYDFIKNIIEQYIDKKRVLSISKPEMEDLIEKIDRELFNENSVKMIDNAIQAIAEFYNIGSIHKNKIPLLAIELFLKEKNLDVLLERLESGLPSEPKQTYDIGELRKLLYNPIPLKKTHYFDRILKQEKPDSIFVQENSETEQPLITEEMLIQTSASILKESENEKAEENENIKSIADENLNTEQTEAEQHTEAELHEQENQSQQTEDLIKESIDEIETKGNEQIHIEENKYGIGAEEQIGIKETNVITDELNDFITEEEDKIEPVPDFNLELQAKVEILPEEPGEKLDEEHPQEFTSDNNFNSSLVDPDDITILFQDEKIHEIPNESKENSESSAPNYIPEMKSLSEQPELNLIDESKTEDENTISKSDVVQSEITDNSEQIISPDETDKQPQDEVANNIITEVDKETEEIKLLENEPVVEQELIIEPGLSDTDFIFEEEIGKQKPDENEIIDDELKIIESDIGKENDNLLNLEQPENKEHAYEENILSDETGLKEENTGERTEHKIELITPEEAQKKEEPEVNNEKFNTDDLEKIEPESIFPEAVIEPESIDQIKIETEEEFDLMNENNNESEVLNEIDEEIKQLSDNIYENTDIRDNKDAESNFTEKMLTDDFVNPVESNFLNEDFFKSKKDFRPREIVEYLSPREIKKLVSVIFNNDTEDFADTIDAIHKCVDLQEAQDVLDSVFKSYHIKPTSKEAHLFRNAIADYFNQ